MDQDPGEFRFVQKAIESCRPEFVRIQLQKFGRVGICHPTGFRDNFLEKILPHAPAFGQPSRPAGISPGFVFRGFRFRFDDFFEYPNPGIDEYRPVFIVQIQKRPADGIGS
jgi:hypothetical protein